jgi:hypothetical protein
LYGFDADRLDWNFANLAATVYNVAVPKPKSPSEFLLKFDAEQEPASGDDIFGKLKLFAAQHNAKMNGR